MFVDVGVVGAWATEIHPPAGYSPWWWVVVGVCLLGIVAVLWWARRTLRSIHAGSQGDLLAELRAATLHRLEAAEQAVRAGDLSTADGAARVSAEVRRFVGTVTNGDADYRVLPELRREATKDPRLDPVVTVVADAERVAFAPTHAADVLAPLVARAREVVQQWT